MIEIIETPQEPVKFAVISMLAGFAFVIAVKIYSMLFRRWKTSFRIGDAMHACRAWVIDWSGKEGYVSADGEIWRATSNCSGLCAGDPVAIAAVDGLMLRVHKKKA